MRGVYTAVIKIAALAGAKTLIYLTAPSTAAIEILSASVTNESNATNQQLECTLQRITTLGSAAGTNITAAKHEAGDQASSASAIVGNLTTEPTTYTANTDIGHEGFASVAGWYFQPMPEERPIVPPGGSLGLRMISAPTAQDTEVRLTWREIG